MNKPSIFVVSIATVFVFAGLASAATPMYLTYTGNTERASDNGAHYLTYTGNTEQASNSGVHYLTYTGDTEQTPAQAPDAVTRYLTSTGDTEQVSAVPPDVRTASGAPQGMSDQEWKAQLIRGAALNRQYHPGNARVPYSQHHLHVDPNAAATQAEMLRGKALNAAYGNEWTRMSPQQFAAFVDMFGTDVTQLSPTQLQQLVANGESGSSNSFGWGSAGIGAAVAALAVALLAVAVRRLRHTPAIA